MALTLGTDAYDTLANVDAYWAARGNAAWAALSDDVREQSIRKATDYIDRTYQWRGEKLVGTQRLGWPRKNATDSEGNDVSNTVALYPWQVQEATARVADLYGQGTADLDGLITADSSVVEVKVDVITEKKDPATMLRGPSIPTDVVLLLRPLTNYGQLLRA